MKNKTAQYLKYALGEIFLVVIGILFALQINNWNEGRIAQKNEAKILQTLLEDLKAAKNHSLNTLKIDEQNVERYKIVLQGGETRKEFLENKYIDSLFYGIIWNVSGGDAPFINSFSDLKNAGQTGLITKEEIRSRFTSLENSATALNGQLDDLLMVQQMQGDHLAMEDINFVQLVNAKHGEGNFEITTKNDYSDLLRDQQILNLLSAKYDLTKEVIRNRRSLIKEIETLLTLIEKELNEV